MRLHRPRLTIIRRCRCGSRAFLEASPLLGWYVACADPLCTYPKGPADHEKTKAVDNWNEMEYSAKSAKICSTCKRQLGPEHFHRNRRTADRLSTRCKSCTRDYGLRRRHK